MSDSNSTLLISPESRPSIFGWVQFVLGFGLLIIVCLFDANRFLQKSWSSLYFLVALYTWWFLRGRAELLLYAALSISTILVPILFRPEMRLANRTTGAIAGWIIIAAMRDRRRFFTTLKQANDELENKVSVRTAELQSSRNRLEALSRQLIMTQEMERSYLARELHDEFCQVLVAMKINIQRIEKSADEKLRAILNENIAMIDRCVHQIRDIALNLRPPHLDELGLSFALNWYLKRQAQIAGFQESLVIVPPEIQVPREIATVCFRIAQEAVTNAITHAAPNRIEIELRHQDRELQLKIHDDGEGFDVKKALNGVAEGNSFGLSSMLERVALANGKIEIHSAPEHGSTIRAWFSLSH